MMNLALSSFLMMVSASFNSLFIESALRGQLNDIERLQEDSGGPRSIRVETVPSSPVEPGQVRLPEMFVDDVLKDSRAASVNRTINAHNTATFHAALESARRGD